MEVWIKQWDYPNDNDYKIAIYFNENEALRSVCKEIQDIITNRWDTGESETQKEYCDNIDDAINDLRFRDAIEQWNDYQINYNEDYQETWSVYNQDVLGKEPTSSSAVVAMKSGYQASTPGATCRGPCGSYNEYAFATNQDGSYMCKQCSMFHSIFGG